MRYKVERIVSLGPALTEKLYLLGAGSKLVANTIYCQRPPEARNKEKIGTVVKVNVEKIISLKPDLVLATSLTELRQVEKLKNSGIAVVTFQTPKDFADICKQFLTLGKLLGKEKEADALLQTVRKKVMNIQKKLRGFKKPKVVVQLGAKPLWVATRDSFINDFIEFAGGINIGPFGKSGLYSREKVIKQNPDVIIIVEMGFVAEEEKKIWQRYKTLNAVRNNRIHIIDSYKLCSPTPVSFAETLEEIARLLHN